MPRVLQLRNSQSLGDAVMLTAAVRDLHKTYPGRFRTEVRTLWPELWLHNPFVARFDADEPSVEVIHCRYPLIEHSNTLPYHFIHGFINGLNDELGLHIRPTAFHGDIHLAEDELLAPSITERLLGVAKPYWLINAGGKLDFTIKWWAPARYQAVVDHFRSRILFVQVGDLDDVHPPLQGVIDLRGKTSVRELVRLLHRAQGVLCPVTGLMHLAAAVPPPAEAPSPRACVVIAGGREPPHWEAYPTHQFIHTVGMLPCCAFGGCWRSRTLPLHDGSEHDAPDSLCLRPTPEALPECMAMIHPHDVIGRIEGYISGPLLLKSIPAG